MSDWIDDIKRERDNGLRRALTQDQHAAVNARYPGTTDEICCECDRPTGRAGRGDGSLYCDECDHGPLCEECWHEHKCASDFTGKEER